MVACWLANGYWLAAPRLVLIGSWLMVVSGWLMAGCWQIDGGWWQVDGWSMVAGRSIECLRDGCWMGV